MLTEKLKNAIENDSRISGLKDMLPMNAVETFTAIVDYHTKDVSMVKAYKEVQDYAFLVAFNTPLNRFPNTGK